MPVTFRCSACTQKLRIDDTFAGKLVSCVRCGAKQRVPLESSPEFAGPKPPAEKSRPEEPPAEPPPAKPAESKPLKPLKPWQPRPVREAPLPSERKPPEAPWREPAPGELSADAISAIFDEPDSPEGPPAQESIREDDNRAIASERHGAEAFEEEPLAGATGDEEQPSAAGPSPAGESEADENQGVEFATGPLLAAQSRQLRAAPAPDIAEGAAPGHSTAKAHAEPSLIPPAKKLDVEEMIDMTAMVDIVFFLLIFFLVTSMHSLDSTIPMPAPDPQKGAAKEPQTIAAIDADDGYVVVRIDKNDKITVEGAEVRSERDLLFKLRDLRLGAARPEKLLVIGHGDATHGTAVMILDAGRELGMDQVKLTVQDEEE